MESTNSSLLENEEQVKRIAVDSEVSIVLPKTHPTLSETQTSLSISMGEEKGKENTSDFIFQKNVESSLPQEGEGHKIVNTSLQVDLNFQTVGVKGVSNFALPPHKVSEIEFVGEERKSPKKPLSPPLTQSPPLSFQSVIGGSKTTPFEPPNSGSRSTESVPFKGTEKVNFELPRGNPLFDRTLTRSIERVTLEDNSLEGKSTVSSFDDSKQVIKRSVSSRTGLPVENTPRAPARETADGKQCCFPPTTRWKRVRTPGSNEFERGE